MTDQALRSLLASYNLELSSVKKLEGYGSQNFSIQTTTGDQYLLKINAYSTNTYIDLLAENELLLSLQAKLAYQIPHPILNRDGNHLIHVDDSIVRCLSFIVGEFWGHTKLKEPALESLGRAMASIDFLLMGQAENALHHRSIPWDLQQVMDNKPLLEYVENTEDTRLIQYYFDQINEFVKPKMGLLRKSLIHNDFNPWNVMFDAEGVSGLIDFGDMVYSSLICELAVSLSYILSNSDNILSDASIVIKSYHQLLPLEESELELLYYLIAGRIITSLCNSAKTKADFPNNEYITISEAPFKKLLYQWIKINPIGFKQMALDACQLDSTKSEYKTELIESQREKNFSTAMSLSYEEPIHMSAAAFQYMYDQDGNTYLDAYNNIPLVGHSHPLVTEAISKQVKKLNTNTRYHYPILGEYSEALLSYFPAKLDKVFFVNSGSAATDLALRLATNFKNRKDFLVLEEGYHGNTQFGIEVSPYKHGHKGGKGANQYIHQLPLAKKYNTDRGLNSYLFEAQDILENLRKQEKLPAGIIAETISGCGGQVPLMKGYLKEIFTSVRQDGGLCIIDEVQTGFGRLGHWFWGFEMQKVMPDIVILGKPIGNAHPMAAVVCTSEIAEAFDNGMEFFSSFGGNPVSCAAGLAVLKVLKQEGLQENARIVGDYWKLGLEELQKDHPCIGDVRGEGLFLGIEIMNGTQADTALATHLKNELKKRFILVGTDGKYNNVLKMKPPLCFSKHNVDHFMCHFKELVAFL